MPSILSKDKDACTIRGNEVTSFGNLSISALKKQLRSVVNEAAEEFDEETREAVKKEGVNVFKLNNKIIGSVSGVNEVLLRKVVKVLIFLILAVLITYFGYHR